MYHYPIYNLVSNTDLARDPNFGAREGFDQDIRVGTSAKNSHTLAKIEVKRHVREDGKVWFALFVDGTYLKGGLLTGKDYESLGPESMPT